MFEQKRFIIVALSLILLSSLPTMATGTSLRAAERLSGANNSRRRRLGTVLDGFDQQIDQTRLLKHAIKVESNHLRSRKLEEGGNEQEGENEGENEGNQDENENDEQEQQNEDENSQDQEDDANEEDNEEENDSEESEEEGEEEEEEEDEEAAEEEEQEENAEHQINFLKCVALTIEPNVMDVDSMLENGEIDEDEAAELESKYITEMTSDLNTQESVVFFTYGNGEDDEDREVFMIGISDWIAASSGYGETCNVLDEDDVGKIFSKIPSIFRAPAEAYSDNLWYSGFNCKADGTGFKSHLFLDESCTTFSRTLNQYYPFRKSNEDYSTEVASDLTKYMIQDASNSVNYAQYCEDSDFCGNVFENSVGLATCEVEEEDEEERRRNLASYQLDYDMASNIGDACPSIQTAFSIDQEYDFSAADLEALVIFWSNTVNGGQDSDRRSLIPGINDAWLFLMGLLAILCIGSSLCVSRTKVGSILQTSSTDTDDTIDSKKEPLVMKRVKPIVSKIPQGASEIEQSFSAIECTLSKKKRKKASEQTEKRKTKTNQFRHFLKKSVSNASSSSIPLSVE